MNKSTSQTMLINQTRRENFWKKMKAKRQSSKMIL